MATVEEQIQEMVDRETRAWNTQDAEALVEIFHPDMVWPWPRHAGDHDPAGWIFPQGRYDRNRWKRAWSRLFSDYELVHNLRTTVRIVASAEGDGGFAVVDADALEAPRDRGALPLEGACLQRLHASGRRVATHLPHRLARLLLPDSDAVEGTGRSSARAELPALEWPSP